jgi:hypothetical protein
MFALPPKAEIRCRDRHVRFVPSGLGIVLTTDTIWRVLTAPYWTVFPNVISGLRKPIAIQAAISFNINLPE